MHSVHIGIINYGFQDYCPLTSHPDLFRHPRPGAMNLAAAVFH